MQNPEPDIGLLDPSETDALGIIFFEAVREGAAAFYDLQQRRAWAPAPPSGKEWAARLSAQLTLVARIDGRPVGFMTLAADGHIDLAFVAPAFQRRGIGLRLYAEIEKRARDIGIARLHTQASHLVRGLFERQGWTLVKAQEVERSGVTLANFVMEKPLAATMDHEPASHGIGRHKTR